ncbi:hypothetical protein ACT3S9_19510 [Pseudoalteromonas sp. AOP31-A2-14]|jgi:hypothetical protein
MITRAISVDDNSSPVKTQTKTNQLVMVKNTALAIEIDRRSKILGI